MDPTCSLMLDGAWTRQKL